MNTKPASRLDLDFCGFRFTRKQLDEAVASIPKVDPRGAATSTVEAMGRNLTSEASDDLIHDFSKRVCTWGGRTGARINAKLRKNPALSTQLRSWFAEVRTATSDEAAIQRGIAISGLAISFASKHLRMLDPNRFAVLDSVLSKELGFALNPRGYALFMRNLRDFRERIGFEPSVATLEYGIFMLVQRSLPKAQRGKP